MKRILVYAGCFAVIASVALFILVHALALTPAQAWWLP